MKAPLLVAVAAVCACGLARGQEGELKYATPDQVKEYKRLQEETNAAQAALSATQEVVSTAQAKADALAKAKSTAEADVAIAAQSIEGGEDFGARRGKCASGARCENRGDDANDKTSGGVGACGGGCETIGRCASGRVGAFEGEAGRGGADHRGAEAGGGERGGKMV